MVWAGQCCARWALFQTKLIWPTAHEILIHIISAVLACACSKIRFSRNTLPYNSKDIVLKSHARISHKQDAFPSSIFFFLKIAFDLGHQRYTCDQGLPWATLHAIRSFLKTKLIWPSTQDFNTIVSALQVGCGSLRSYFLKQQDSQLIGLCLVFPYINPAIYAPGV